uniref:Uncharacterized protein n=1 Tax=Haemonchus contortus TaxID=6289 RepID=A0A7I4Z7F6_HAECO
MIFVKLRSMLLFLGVLAIAVESIKIKFYYGGDARNCRESELVQRNQIVPCRKMC